MSRSSHIIHIMALSALLVCQMFAPADARAHGVRRALRTISASSAQKAAMPITILFAEVPDFDD